MSNTVFEEAKKFVETAERLGVPLGRTANEEEIKLLREKFGKKIPDWYCALLSALPFVRMEVPWQAFQPDDEDDGVSPVEICEPMHMIDESFEAYPGILALDGGFICVGSDPTESGDPYFVKFEQDDPPVFQFYHDVGEDIEGILKDGSAKVADSLSDFFRNGVALMNRIR